MTKSEFVGWLKDHRACNDAVDFVKKHGISRAIAEASLDTRMRLRQILYRETGELPGLGDDRLADFIIEELGVVEVEDWEPNCYFVQLFHYCGLDGWGNDWKSAEYR